MIKCNRFSELPLDEFSIEAQAHIYSLLAVFSLGVYPRVSLVQNTVSNGFAHLQLRKGKTPYILSVAVDGEDILLGEADGKLVEVNMRTLGYE